MLGAFKIEETPNAENITNAVISALQEAGKLTAAQIGGKLVAVAADGASVMAGEFSGVLTVSCRGSL